MITTDNIRPVAERCALYVELGLDGAAALPHHPQYVSERFQRVNVGLQVLAAAYLRTEEALAG